MNKAIIIYIIGLIVNMTIYILYLSQIPDPNNVKRKHKYLHKIIRIISIFFFGIFIPVTAITVHPQSNYNVPDNLLWMAIPFMVLSTVIMYTAYNETVKFNDLKQKCPTIAQKRHTKFIESGIYKYVRHPMYLAALIFLIAQGILLPNRYGIASSIISICILVMSKIPEEEKLLIHEFGFEYIRYMKETAEIIPFLV